MDDFYIKRICNGDHNAFRYFIKTYKDIAYSIAISVVKDEFIAQEVTQDAFMKTFKNIGSFRKKSTFSTWFYRIVTNEALMRLRKLKMEIIDFTDINNDDISDENAILSLKDDEQTYLINEAFRKLSSKESLALRLFYFQEQSVKEVCEITGWSEANTKVILHRARKNMFIVLTQLMKTDL